MGRPRTDPVIRFWRQVDKRSPKECWPWLGATDDGGYGLLQLQEPRKLVRVARFSFVLAQGGNPVKKVIKLSPKRQVMHSCDNPACVNPRHLSLGSCLKNMRDKMAKGRHVVWNKGKKGVQIPSEKTRRRMSRSQKRRWKLTRAQDWVKVVRK